MTGRIGIRSFLAVTGATVLALLVVSVMLPHSAYIRYQSFEGTIFARLTWVYDRLVHDDSPIDVLLVGSSRTGRGVPAALLEDALAQRGRGDLRVANISEPASGLDIRLTKIREALRAHPEIRLIVLGVVEALPRDGHQAFGDLATAGEILTAPWIVNRTLPGNIAALPYRQIELFVASHVPAAFGRRTAFDPGAYPGPTPELRRFNDPSWDPAREAARVETAEHAAALAAESEIRRREIRPPILPDSLGWIEFGVSRHYIDAILALAEDHGAEVAFMFLPFYRGFDAPMDAAWLEDRGPLWAADVLDADPRNYIDAGHPSVYGVELILPWLAERIDTTLPPETRP